MSLGIDIPISDYEVPDNAKSVEIETTHGGAVEFGIIGVGQCGGKLAKAFYDAGYKKAIAINTALVDLVSLDLPENHKLLVDAHAKDGAGKDMKKGAEAIRQNSQEVFDLMKRILGKVDHIFVVFGLGGGSGGGGSLEVISVAKKYVEHLQIGDPKQCVGAIVTLPTAGELNSSIIKSNTRDGLGAIGKLARAKEISTLLIIDNDKIGKIYQGLTGKQFWPVVNSTISSIFHAFNKLSCISSEYENFDTADYRSIIQCGGCCVMGHAKLTELNSSTDVSRALTTNIQKNLLAAGMDLESAAFAGCIAVASTEVMEKTVGLMDMLRYGFDALSNIIGNATLHRGVYEDPSAKHPLQVFTIIGGLRPPSKTLMSLGANVQAVWGSEEFGHSQT